MRHAGNAFSIHRARFASACLFVLAWLLCAPPSIALAGAVAGCDSTGVAWGEPPGESIDGRPVVLIPVPLVRQGRDNTCGVACVQAILRYAGYEFDVREELLIEQLSVAEDGTPFVAMADFLNQVRRCGDDGGDVMSTAMRENMTIADLVRAVSAGRPVICLIQAWRANAAGDYELRHD